MKVTTLEKFHLNGEGWGGQDPGDPGVGKVRGGNDFFSFNLSRGRELTLDDTMTAFCKVLTLLLPGNTTYWFEITCRRYFANKIMGDLHEN